MPFWAFFLTWAASMVVGELLRPKMQIDNAKPAGLSDFDFPTATESRQVPVIWGTVELKAPNVVWWGDLTNTPIKKRAGKGGFMGMGRTIWQTVGYRYHAGMHLALCHGPAELLELRANDKAAWSGTSTGGLITVDNEGLFGGEDSGGGLAAAVNFLPGNLTQAVDPYLQSQLGTPLPAWRGIASLIWYGPSRSFDRAGTVAGVPVTNAIQSGYLGTNPRIAPISAVMRRLPSNLGLTTTQTNLQGDANAAELIYECFTSLDFGLGIPPALMDTAAFVASGQTLAAEGFGVSAVWDSARQNLRQFLDEVLRTIDGVCYLDHRTGKWTMSLARGGYSVAALPVLDETSIDSLDGYSATALDETVNEIVLTYRDRAAGFADRQVKAQSFSNVRFQDAVVSQAMSYPMLSRGDLAAKVADRDLRALSTPLAKCDLVANRTARAFKPGDVFVLSWSPLGLTQVVMRVLRASAGDLHDGSVRLSCIQDVFALGSSLYGSPSPTGWVDPVQPPAPCPGQLLSEAPYHLTRSDIPKLQVAPQRPNGSCRDFEIWAKRSGEADFSYRGTGLAFCPVGYLIQGYGLTSAVDEGATLIVSGNADLGILASVEDAELRQGGNLAVFESGEVICFRRVIRNADGTATLTGVWRGLLDSVPAEHAANERLWFVAYGQATTEDALAASESVFLKLLPGGSRGVLPIASATAATLVVGGRAAKPYPCGNLVMNGGATYRFIMGDLTATWLHRHRVQQTLVTRQDDPSLAAPEGTYTIRQIVGIPAESWQLTLNGQALSFTGWDGQAWSQGFSTVGQTIGTTMKFFLLPDDPPWTSNWTLGYSLTDTGIPDRAVRLWDVPVVAGAGGLPYPGTVVDRRVSTASTTTGSTATTQGLTAAQRLALYADGRYPVRIGVTTVNGSLQSVERKTPPTTMTGLGMTLGLYLGGFQQ